MHLCGLSVNCARVVNMILGIPHETRWVDIAPNIIIKEVCCRWLNYC